MTRGPTIGVLSPYVGGSYYGGILTGIARAASAIDGRVVAVQTVEAGSFHADSVGTSGFRDQVAWDHVGGFIVVANAVDSAYLDSLRTAGKSVVLVSNEAAGFSCPVVLPDNSGIRSAVAHLIEHGHRDISFVGCLSVFDVRERYDGYVEALREHGVEPDPRLVFETENNHETGGDQAGLNMIAAGLPATAAVAGTDLNAIGLMRTLGAAGYDVPGDLAVVGFDDIDAARQLVPSLSTIRQPLHDLGRTAMELLLRLQDGEHVPPGRHYVKAPFVPRESCGCPDPAQVPREMLTPAMAQAQVRSQFQEAAYFQDLLATQYESSIGLLRSHQEDPRSLGWLARTPVRGGCLGLWGDVADADGAGRSDRPTGGDRELDVVGVFVRDRRRPRLGLARRTVGAFPPEAMLALAEDTPLDVVLVVPVRMDTSDWGLLALVGAIEERVPAGREMVNQSAALLAVALDHKAVMMSLRKQEDKLRLSALYDDLTGLPNRTLFLDRLSVAIARSKRADAHGFAVLFLDLDGFKVVNDSLGHAAGDQLLVQVGRRISEDLREVDTAARFGGDEFIVLLEGTSDLAAATAAAGRVQEALARPFQVAGEEVVVTASVGVALSAPRYESAEDILRDADIAMYSAKSHEKGSHAVFDVAMHAKAVTRLQMEADLRRALERDELELHYQPIVDLGSAGLSAFEALLRWRHPTRGLVQPEVFLAVAEECGLMVPIGRWVLREACRQLASWQRTGVVDDAVRISVNVSSRQFWHDDLLDVVATCLQDAGLPAGCLALEITESVIMSNVDVAREMLDDLHELGVGLHIDDFGTGFSSLEALHRLPLGALKIDRSFVARLDTDTRSAELVPTIVLMGANLGLGLIAKGVETTGQRDLLRSLGCTHAQGYLYSRAVPATDAAAVAAGMSSRLDAHIA